jgi:hypothetical protein
VIAQIGRPLALVITFAPVASYRQSSQPASAGSPAPWLPLPSVSWYFSARNWPGSPVQTETSAGAPPINGRCTSPVVVRLFTAVEPSIGPAAVTAA